MQSSYAEKKLAEIKAKNAEAQRNRRRRLREQENSSGSKTSSVASSESDVKTTTRRWQNAEAQRRRRQRLKQRGQEVEEEVTQLPIIAAPTATTKSTGRQVKRESLLPLSLVSKNRSTNGEDEVTIEDIIDFCHMNAKCTMEGEDLVAGQAHQHIYSLLFGPGRSAKESFSYNHIVADYLQYEATKLGLNNSALVAGNWSSLPSYFLPTKIQVAYPDHFTIIDLFPWPSFRDRIILLLAREQIECMELCADMLQHPRLTGKISPFIIRGEPTDVNSWEVAQWFFEKYRILFDQEALKSSNVWRSLRGEARLISDYPTLDTLTSSGLKNAEFDTLPVSLTDVSSIWQFHSPPQVRV
jgi:hypothetical protein